MCMHYDTDLLQEMFGLEPVLKCIQYPLVDISLIGMDLHDANQGFYYLHGPTRHLGQLPLQVLFCGHELLQMRKREELES